MRMNFWRPTRVNSAEVERYRGGAQGDGNRFADTSRDGCQHDEGHSANEGDGTGTESTDPLSRDLVALPADAGRPI